MENKSEKFLGIDYGDFSIGLAIYDVATDFIYPYKTIFRERPNALRKSLREIADIVSKENIIKIVIGYPLNMNDTEGERVEKVKLFKEKLDSKLNESVMIDFQDERLTTKEAHEILKAHGIKKADEKKHIDQVAAEIILEDYKNERKNNE